MTALGQPQLPPLIVNSNQGRKYVCTYKNVWDPEKKTSKRASSGTVGKFIPSKDDPTFGEVLFYPAFVEKHPELEHFKVFRRKGGKLEFRPVDGDSFTLGQRSATEKLHGGATWALDTIVRGSPFGIALKAVFNDRNEYEKILSLVYYLVLKRDNALSNYEEFAECTWLPFQVPLRSHSISRLLKRITLDRVERFLKALYREFKKQYGGPMVSHTFYALDSTSISTYSSLPSAEWGHNKDLTDLPQTNVLLVVEQQTRIPVYFRNFDGNVPDVMTIRNTIADMARIGIKDPSAVFVSDKGYVSVKNIDDCLRNNLSFIFNTKVNSQGFARQVALENYLHLLDWNNGISFLDQTAYTAEVEWKYDAFPVAGRRAANKDCARIYAHIYYNSKINADRTGLLQQKMFNIRNKYLTEPDKVTADEMRYIDRYAEKKEGDIRIRMDRINEDLKLAGIRVLVSDAISDPLECYLAYEERKQVEYAFNTLKARLGCNRIRTHSVEAWNGKLFIEILATALSGIVRNRLKEYNGTAKKKSTKYTVIHDSDVKILGKLNNIMMTRFKDGWYFDEIAGKKKELFLFLNVPVPSANKEIGINTGYDDQEEDWDEGEDLILRPDLTTEIL